MIKDVNKVEPQSDGTLWRRVQCDETRTWMGSMLKTCNVRALVPARAMHFVVTPACVEVVDSHV